MAACGLLPVSQFLQSLAAATGHKPTLIIYVGEAEASPIQLRCNFIFLLCALLYKCRQRHLSLNIAISIVVFPGVAICRQEWIILGQDAAQALSVYRIVIAQMAQDGIARTVRPAHTMLDGDTIFALSTGEVAVDFNIVGAFAAEVVSEAIVNAVRSAASAGGLPGTGSATS